MTRSSKLKVHRAYSQMISLYPVRFSTDSFFSFSLSFPLFIFLFCFFYIEIRNVYSDTHSTMWVGE